MEQLQLKVSGMSCSGCEQRIERALANLDGVVRSQASHLAGEVRVVLDESRTRPDQVRACIARAGYEVSE